MEKREIKNIIFDIGNVLIGYRWKDMLIDDFGVDPEMAETIGTCAFGDPSWKRFDSGEIDLSQVIGINIEKHPELRDGIRLFFSEPKRMRVERPKVYERVRELREKGYGIYVLSNYSKELLNEHAADLEFWQDVDGSVISYEVGLLKPEGEIYRTLLRNYALNAAECLFFDDRADNVEGANAEGIESILVTGEAQLLEELNKL